MVSSFPFAKEICKGNGSLWWAGGIRKGLARLKALSPRPEDLVVIANSDTVLERDFVENAVREIDLVSKNVMLCASVRFVDTDRWIDGGTVCYWPRLTFKHYGIHPEKIDCASTRCLFFTYSNLSVSGSFRPGLLPHYLSDYEFTIRARRRGIRLFPAQSVVCLGTEQITGFHELRPAPSGASPLKCFPQSSRQIRSPSLCLFSLQPLQDGKPHAGSGRSGRCFPSF